MCRSAVLTAAAVPADHRHVLELHPNASGALHTEIILIPAGRHAQVSLPMLAPLLLGTGMMFRSIKANASIIFPRIGFMVVLLWVRRHMRLDRDLAGILCFQSSRTAWAGFRTALITRLHRTASNCLMPTGLLQVLWFANSVVQNTVMYLRRQGAIDHRWAWPLLAAAC